MSGGGRSTMNRIILHRSLDRLHIQYEDGHREEIFDRERIRWLLLENHSLVSLLIFSLSTETHFRQKFVINFLVDFLLNNINGIKINHLIILKISCLDFKPLNQNL